MKIYYFYEKKTVPKHLFFMKKGAPENLRPGLAHRGVCLPSEAYIRKSIFQRSKCCLS
jgi:hypothetical protein